MKKLLLLTTGLVVLLLIFIGGTSCARVFPPAGPPVGPEPGPALEPPLLPHGVAEECLACHGTDQRFLASLQEFHPVPVPPGFTGNAGDACRLCHTMEEGHTLAREMPHPLKGMESCFTCHAGEAPGIARPPVNHSNYAVERCNECHAISEVQPAVPGETPATPTMPGKASPIPHKLEGMGDCLSCHGKGLPGISPLPSDHGGRSNESCGGCHRPS